MVADFSLECCTKKHIEPTLTTHSMPQENFRAFLQSKLEAAAAATTERERCSDLRQFFYAALSEVAEDVIDKEMRPINGTPTEAQFSLRQDSVYYPYNLAKANAYAAFSDDQRAVLRGLLMRTAFEVLDGVFYTLDCMPDCELEMRLCPEIDGAVESVILSRDTDELRYGRNHIPKGLTKYEM